MRKIQLKRDLKTTYNSTIILKHASLDSHKFVNSAKFEIGNQKYVFFHSILPIHFVTKNRHCTEV